jgi:peroxiredoxin Q/BCP
MMLNVGDVAPEFSLSDQDGTPFSLRAQLGKKVLIWFFPKASTPGCTAQGCSLRDHHGQLLEKDVVVVGISMDSVRRQKNFATKKEFPFTLIADQEGVAVRAFGAWGPKKFMGREYEGILRSSFLIDEEGKITHVFSKVQTKTHGEDVLVVLG